MSYGRRTFNRHNQRTFRGHLADQRMLRSPAKANFKQIVDVEAMSPEPTPTTTRKVMAETP